MKKLIKLLLPILFLIGYVCFSYFIFDGINEDVFLWQDCLRIVLGNVFVIILLLGYMKLIGIPVKRILKNCNLNIRKIGFIWLIIPGVHFLFSRIILVVMEKWNYTYMPTILELGDKKLFVFDTLFALLLAPLLEELLFRACILSSYRTLAGKLYGIFVSSFLFGFSHSGTFQRAGTTVTALILSILYLKTNDLLLCVFIHSSINLMLSICASIVIYLKDYNMMHLSSSIIFVCNPILAVALLLSCIGAILYYKSFAHERRN